MFARDAFRLSGETLVFGAVALFASGLLLALLFSDDNPMQSAQPMRVALEVLSAFAAALLLLGLPALYARWMTGYGALGLVGLVCIALTLMLFGFFSLVSGLVLPSIAEEAPHLLTGPPPSLTPLALLDLVCGTIGPVLLAIPSIRGRVPSRLIGWAWLLCGVFSAIGFFTTGSDAGIVTGLINQASALFGAVAVFGLGVRLLKEPRSSPDATGEVSTVLAPMST
jgi:hypothetical protein